MQRPGAEPWTRRFPLLLLGSALFLATGCSLPHWPVSAPLTSPYGMRWDGVLPRLHRGVDLAAPLGTEVHTMASGRVRFAGTMRGFGKVVWIDHGGQVLTVYAHLSEIRVEEGASVSSNTILGLSGQSGNAAGPHLHFEVWRWGREVDPVPLLGSPPSF